MSSKLKNPRIVASEYKNRSILITKEVYHKIYPFEQVARTVPVIFSRNGGRAEVEQEIADYLAENYPGISIDPLPEPVYVPVVEPEPEPEQAPVISIPDIEIPDDPEPEPEQEEPIEPEQKPEQEPEKGRKQK